MNLPTIRFENPFVFPADIDIETNRLTEYRNSLQQIIAQKNWEAPEASLLLPDNEKIFSDVQNIASRFEKNSLKYIVVIGIGGSNLGAQAVYESLYADHPHPELLFADTVSSKKIRRILEKLFAVNAEEFALIVISKSGTTMETSVIFDVFYHELKNDFPNLDERIVCITEEDSALAEWAGEHGNDTLSIPKTVGGRYSVLSAVGLLPLALAGINIQELKNGAREMRDACLQSETDISSLAAIHAFLSLKNSHPIYNTFVFNPELESYGKWFRQLFGESIGKELTMRGEEISAGMLPTVSVGTADLHSIAQLYFSGSVKLFTSFIYTEEESSVYLSSPNLTSKSGTPISSMPIAKIMSSIFDGVRKTYEKRKMPFMDIRLDRMDAFSLGALMQFNMLQVMYLAKLLDVNAFDQPNVELYKKEVKAIFSEL